MGGRMWSEKLMKLTYSVRTKQKWRNEMKKREKK
jgi:hypothetical protein